MEHYELKETNIRRKHPESDLHDEIRTRLPQLRPDKLSPFYQHQSVFGPLCVPYRPVGYAQSHLTGKDTATGSLLLKAPFQRGRL